MPISIISGLVPGTFDEIFPLYRLEAIDAFVWDNAHNGYLELALGLGLPATLFIIIALLLLAWRCLKEHLSGNAIRSSTWLQSLQFC